MGKTTYHFNPYELAFCGYSGSGKTTLVIKLIEMLGAERRIGYVKHDGHRFAMDTPGKDTHRASEAGATSVLINDASHVAQIDHYPLNEINQRQALLDCEWVIIEGYKQSTMPKILVLDAQGRALADYQAGKFDNVLACVGPAAESPKQLAVPYFQRDSIDDIAVFVQAHYTGQAQALPLRGLFMVGGQSSRMGIDKAELTYENESQLCRGVGLLGQRCEHVYVSQRQEQAYDLPNNCTALFDSYINMGPLGGILSALSMSENAAYMVIACDMPLLNTETLDALLAARNPYAMATVFVDEQGQPEPLCAIYEAKAFARLHMAYGLGYCSIRKILSLSMIERIAFQTTHCLNNINTPEDYQNIQKEFTHGKEH